MLSILAFVLFTLGFSASSCRVWHKRFQKDIIWLRPWAQFKSTVACGAIRTLPPFWCYLWGSSPSCQSAFVSKWSELHEGTAAYRALHLCVEAACLQWATSAVHKLHKEGSRRHPPPKHKAPPHARTHAPPPPCPWCASGLAWWWWWLILEGGKCEQVLRQMDGWAFWWRSPRCSQVPLRTREWRLV